MKYDHLGIEFLKIAAFLYVARFIAVALMGPKSSKWEPASFNYSYECIGRSLTSLAILSAVIGVLLIIAAFINSHKKNRES